MNRNQIRQEIIDIACKPQASYLLADYVLDQRKQAVEEVVEKLINFEFDISLQHKKFWDELSSANTTAESTGKE